MKLSPEMIERLRSASARGQKVSASPVPALADIRVSVAAGQHTPADGAVLYDSAAGDAGQFTFLAITFADKGVTADALDPELTRCCSSATSPPRGRG
jgi:Ca-activated chloride channel family protein